MVSPNPILNPTSRSGKTYHTPPDRGLQLNAFHYGDAYMIDEPDLLLVPLAAY
jgi:hypothetical protein